MPLEQFQHHEFGPPPGINKFKLLRNRAKSAVTYIDFKAIMREIEEELQHIRGAVENNNGDEDKDERERELEAIKEELNQRYEEKFGGSLLQ